MLGTLDGRLIAIDGATGDRALSTENVLGGEGEGYRLTTMYSGSGGKVLMQGVTDTKLGLQGVAMFTDFLPGATFKFHPVLGQGPNGDINQGVFDLSYKGGDWCAAVKAGPQTNGEASWHQQLSQGGIRALPVAFRDSACL